MDFNKDQLTKVLDQTSRLGIKRNLNSTNLIAVLAVGIDCQKGVSSQFCCSFKRSSKYLLFLLQKSLIFCIRVQTYVFINKKSDVRLN